MADNGQSILIKDLEKTERPREKAMLYGLNTLTDAELMAIIFATGIKGKSVIDLCNDILRDNNGHLSKVTKLSVKEMCKRYKGIGEVKAITLLAALQLGARAAKDAKIVEERPITSSEDAYQIMRHHIEMIDHEEFWVLLLNRSGRVIRDVQISQGGTAATVVDVKLILKSAIENLASAIILFHNHPSGTLSPSREDDSITKKVTDAAKLMDIRVNDHIIISHFGYYSYNDHGRM